MRTHPRAWATPPSPETPTRRPSRRWHDQTPPPTRLKPPPCSEPPRCPNGRNLVTTTTDGRHAHGHLTKQLALSAAGRSSTAEPASAALLRGPRARPTLPQVALLSPSACVRLWKRTGAATAVAPSRVGGWRGTPMRLTELPEAATMLARVTQTVGMRWRRHVREAAGAPWHSHRGTHTRVRFVALGAHHARMAGPVAAELGGGGDDGGGDLLDGRDRADVAGLARTALSRTCAHRHTGAREDRAMSISSVHCWRTRATATAVWRAWPSEHLGQA